jgi:hypothetical protein
LVQTKIGVRFVRRHLGPASAMLAFKTLDQIVTRRALEAHPIA